MAVDIDELRRASRAIYAEVDRDVADDIARLLVAATDEIDRLRSQNNRMRHLLTGDVSWLTGSVSFMPASAAARDRADRVMEAIRDLFAGDGEA